MTDARVGERGLSVEHEADGLHRFNGERLIGLNQRALMREIVHTDWVSSVERSPERSEHLVAHTGATIPRRTHHRPHLPITGLLCKPSATVPVRVLPMEKL